MYPLNCDWCGKEKHEKDMILNEYHIVGQEAVNHFCSNECKDEFIKNSVECEFCGRKEPECKLYELYEPIHTKNPKSCNEFNRKKKYYCSMECINHEVFTPFRGEQSGVGRMLGFNSTCIQKIKDGKRYGL